jgi:hypothetical protein
VADVGACRQVLRQDGLSPQLLGDLTCVASPDACGVVIGFRPAGVPLG